MKTCELCYLYSEDVNDIMKKIEEHKYSDSVIKKINKYILEIVKKVQLLK